MRAVEFQTDLEGKDFLRMPKKITNSLPVNGRAKVIVLIEADQLEDDDSDWFSAAYEQFDSHYKSELQESK